MRPARILAQLSVSVCFLLITGWAIPTAAQIPLTPAYNTLTTDAVVITGVSDSSACASALHAGDPMALSACTTNGAGQQQTAISRYPRTGPIASDAAFGPAPASPNETYSGKAHAQATGYWNVGASATDSYTCASGGSGVGCSQGQASLGVATLSDTFQVYVPTQPIGGCPDGGNCGPAAGSPGTMLFTFDVKGSATGLGGASIAFGQSGGCASFVGCGRIDDFNGNGYTLWYRFDGIAPSPTGDTRVTAPVPVAFSYSGPSAVFPVVVTLGFAAKTISPGFGSSSSAAAFADTLTLSRIDVLDSNGSPVSGYRILAGSGIDLTNIAVGSVPEPSTWALLGAGVYMISLRLARRRRLDD